MHEFKRRFPRPPDDWTQQKISDIADRVNQRNAEANQNVLTISAEHGLISQSEYFSRRVASESVLGYFLLESGDFAYNKSYSKGYPLGAIRRLDRYTKGCVSPLYICFRPKASVVDSDFLKHYLDGGAIDAGLADVAKEGVRNHGLLNVGVADFFELGIPLPPMAEQEMVARILDTLDTTIRQTEAIIEKLKQVKQGLLHDLLTRGIDANGELRPPQSEAPHLYKASPLGWIPVQWVIKRLDEYCVSVADGTHDSPKPADVGYPLITSKNLKGGSLDLTGSYLISDADYRAVRARSSVEAGDILFGMIGTVGSPVVIEPGQDQIATKNVGLLRVGGDFLRGRFLKHWLESAATDRQLSEVMSGSTQRFIGLGTLRSLLTVEPSAEELSEVVAAAGKFSARIEHEERELRKLILLKSGLMDDLLTGRVRVTPLLAQPAAT